MVGRREILVVAIGLLAGGCGPTRVSSTLTVGPQALDLGSVAQGQRKTGQFSFRNPTSSLVQLDRLETSCPCMQLAPGALPLRIAPSGEAAMDVTFDTTDEPNFRGNLHVKLDWFDPAGRLVCSAKVIVAVHSPED